MSTKPLFLLRKAKKSSGEPDVVLWASDDFESTCATLDYLIVKSGKKLSSYFKAVATNFPVVNDLPAEGEIDFTWSERYQLSKDSMTWELKPGAAPDNAHYQGNTNVNGEDMTEIEENMLLPILPPSQSTTDKQQLRFSALETLILQEIKMGVKMSLELPWPNDERLQQLCENLLNNQGYLPTLDNLADKINVSSRTLMRLFVKETGLTFRHWVQQMHVISAFWPGTAHSLACSTRQRKTGNARFTRRTPGITHCTG
ncbi:hypothetical protein P1S72_07425 [Escherichia coli]|nr:hypothetical protein [Escherichia coli]